MSNVTDIETDANAPTRDDEGNVVRRVAAFLVERFPPAPTVILLTVLFVAATLMSGIVLDPELTGSLGDVQIGAAICGFLGSLLYIVRLRVYDDVKDADTDRTENPTRPIPRGLVTVRELDAAGLLILVVEGALIASIGSTTFTLWVIAAVWSVLMRLEFFVSEWLDDHVATFAISHMAAMGFVYGMLMAIGIDMRGGDANPTDLLTSPVVIGAMLAATSIGIGFEWGRKFERYFETHGERAWSLWMMWPSMGAIGFTALARDDYPTWTLLSLIIVCLLTIFGHALVTGQRPRRITRDQKRGKMPTGKLRELVEVLPGVTGLLVYLMLAAAGVAELVG